MLLEQHLFQLFGNLPYLPKAEITKHLEQFDLIKAFLVSENWDDTIKNRQNRKKGQTSYWLYSEPNRVGMRVSYYKTFERMSFFIDFPVESALENSTEIVENGDRVICHSQSFEDFENRILATFHKLRTWFDVETCEIQVNLDHGFNLEFLKKLHLEKLGSFELSGDKKNCQVDGKELSDLLNTWKIGECIRIKTETIGRFEGNSEMLEGGGYEFADSRWITGAMFIKISGPATFKRCLLTSEDFNQLFKKWKNAKKFVGTLECHMENELDVEKVLEGLRAKKWNPRNRGRIYRENGACTYYDLADGMDLYRIDGEIGTIHISNDKKVIKFFWWYNKLPLGRAKKNCTGMIKKLKLKLEQFVWSPKKFAKMAKDVEYYQAELRILNEKIIRENL